MIIEIKTIPASKHRKIVCDVAGNITCYVKKSAKSGAANQELINLLAKKLGIDCNMIKIIRGKTGKKKQLLLPDIADVYACICS